MIETSETIQTSRDSGTVQPSKAAIAPADRARAEDGEFPLEPCATTIAELCDRAIADVAARFRGRKIEYAPDPDPGLAGAGEWDVRRVAYALTILLEDALKRTSDEDVVSVRWREHESSVVVRVQYPRPLERGDRFVTYFEEGVRPDGAGDSVGTLRVAAALKIARQHAGQLARIRTWSGTAYVLELPRSAAAVAGDGAESVAAGDDGPTAR